jgi:hypothetical protein
MAVLQAITRVFRGSPSKTVTVPVNPPWLTGEAATLMSAYLTEWQAAGSPAWNIDPTAYLSGQRLLADTPEDLRVETVILAVRCLFDRPTLAAFTTDHWAMAYAVQAVLNRLLRQRLPLTSDQAVWLLDRLTAHMGVHFSFVSVPLVLQAVGRALGPEVTAPPVQAALKRLQRAVVEHPSQGEQRKILATIEDLLGAPPNVERLLGDGDDWGSLARAHLDEMDADDRHRWLALLAFAATAKSAHPSTVWLKRARDQVAANGVEAFRVAALAWLALVRATANGQPRATGAGFMTTTAAIVEPNATTLKGLVWCCALDPSPEMARALAETAEACFKKIPGVHCRSMKVGTACVDALGVMDGTDGVHQLQRLRGRVKLKAALKTIDAVLDGAARRSGTSREDLDDLAVPTFDLEGGRRRWEFAEGAAEVVLVSSRAVELRWYGPDGSARKTVPAALKRDHGAALKEIKQTVADMEKALAAQVDRFERFFLAERSWSLGDWRTRYIDHPLLSTLARRLIWRFATAGQTALGAWHDGTLVGPDDRPLAGLTEETRVALWHPIESEAATVDAWQRWLERHEVTQPFKQAHREVYVLTEAELQTRTYSNRFAAHILRQHQFHALCGQRGWSFRLLGWWDDWNEPTLALPRWNLSVSFRVDRVGLDDDAERTAAFACLRIATDQVRFDRPDGQRGIPLTEVPPLLFSEVMRDVDLFVGVCSVGNDPTWQDGGPDRYRAYWIDYSFGALSVTAQTRHAVLERLLPRLKIASRCTLEERFLVVRGDRKTYKIHLGSGNILMEPNNQYLCIVPGRGNTGGDVYLPFEGDNQLSIILSKAFMLANDTAIKDPTITRQLR